MLIDRMDRRSALGLVGAAGASGLIAKSGRAFAAAPVVRLASLKFGSVSWLVEIIRHERLEQKHGFTLEIVEVATNQAGPVSLLAGQSDVIVSDWTWALRQRAKGDLLKFAPYSSALGSLMVPKDSTVKTLADLEGKKIGVAGSGVDKSWLLLRAYSRKVLGKDLATITEPVFGAAPLMTAEFSNGRLDAVLNFWTFAARLAGGGARQLLSVAEMAAALDIKPIPSLVGFIWFEEKVASAGVPISALLAAVGDSNATLKSSDAAWDHIKFLVKPASDEEFSAIKTYFRSGIPSPWGAPETASAEKLAKLLVELGDTDLIGDGTSFDPTLFYTANG